MDIKDILSTLGLDLTNPEVKQGAMDAIDAILNSRAPAMPALSGIAGGMSGEMDVELDPDLLQPSVKNSGPAGDDDADIEINDEDDVLKNIKHNDSEDQQNTGISNDTETGNSSDASSSSDSSKTSSSKPSDDNSQEQSGEATSGTNSEDGADKGDTNKTSATDTSKQSVDTNDADSADSTLSQDANTTETGTVDKDETNSNGGDSDDSGDSDATGADAVAGKDAADADEETSADLNIDEDEIVDDTLKSPYEDQAEKAKYEARRIKRERTLAAAKKALEDAKIKNKPKGLINELEKAIGALEDLQEAVNKNLKNISDEEFNLAVNRVFDAIDALGNSGLTYTSEEERKIQAKEIQDDMDNAQTRAELSSEDIAKIRAETQAIKAREKEAAKYATKSPGQFKGFQDFLNSLYRAIALQVAAEEARDDTWSAINRRYGGTGVLKQGQRINELPNKKIPVIDFYFDQSGSWSERDVRVGEQAVSALVDMQEKGQIKINVYYFSNHVHTNAQDARNEGGTWAWNEIVKNVIATQATNVVIMTDDDMEDRYDIEGYFSGGERKAMTYTVPGYVWYLWRHGSNAPRLPRDLKGRGGVQQYSF